MVTKYHNQLIQHKNNYNLIKAKSINQGYIGIL